MRLARRFAWVDLTGAGVFPYREGGIRGLQLIDAAQGADRSIANGRIGYLSEGITRLDGHSLSIRRAQRLRKVDRDRLANE